MPAPLDLVAAARNLRADAVTAEVVDALRGAGIRPLLLKGPAIAAWLYPDGIRGYGDTDLLVAPRDLAPSERVLSELGFAKFVAGVEICRDVPSLAWLRRRDGAIVDLHGTLTGVGAEPASAWRILSEQTETIAVATGEVETLDTAGRALHVALHAAQHGRRERKPLADLARALDRLDGSTWQRATSLADRLQATAAFAAGLRLLPAGAALAADLCLQSERPVDVALRACSAPTGAFAFERLASASGIGAKTAVIARAIVPSREHMRAFLPLARRGLAGLAAAYAWRTAGLAARVGPSAAAWRRARREAS